VDHSLGRVLDLFGLDAGVARRWQEPPGPCGSWLASDSNRSAGITGE
ncbi:aromatic acid decarboxylase, partial [Pseudomonas sp. HMWF021]